MYACALSLSHRTVLFDLDLDITVCPSLDLFTVSPHRLDLDVFGQVSAFL